MIGKRTCTNISGLEYNGLWRYFMIRNTVAYRRFWYVRRRNARKFIILLKLAAIAGILWFVFFYFNRVLIEIMPL